MPELHKKGDSHYDAEGVEAWIRYAQSDLALASIDRPKEVLSEMLCFHAQQSGEKALKALLVYFAQPVPRSHNLATILTLLNEFVDIPSNVKVAAGLTVYAVISRYPGDFADVSEDEYREAIFWAEEILDWVTSIIE